MLTTLVKTTDTRYGRMSYFAADAYIGRSLELYGEYSPGEIELMAKIVKPGWAVVNGGANIGALTAPLAELVGPDGKVYAFEPQPELVQLLRRNMRKRKNVMVSDYALWHSRGDNRVRKVMELQHDNFGCFTIGDDGGSGIVRMIALDDWLQGEDVQLIFADVEGCEAMLLEGAKQTIKRCRPLFYLEDHPDRARLGVTDLVSYVRQQDYLAYSHKPDMYSVDNWKKCPENAFMDLKNFELKPYKTLSFNILCIPQERIAEFRYLLDDHTKFHAEPRGTKLQMIVPRSPNQGAGGWACIVRGGGVGDNLIAAAPARSLKEMGYKVEILTQTPNNVVFENNPFVDKISVHDEADWPKDQVAWQEFFRIRAKEYDRFANLAHSCEARHALFPIMTAFWWSQEYRRKLCAGSYLETAFDILGVPYSFGPLFFPTSEEREQALITKRKLGQGPIIGWCLGGTRLDKVWPYTPLLIGRLIKELDAQVVMMGAPPPFRDFEIARAVQDSVRAQNGSDAGLTHASSLSLKEQTWPIRRILSFAQVCDLVIGPDTGPSWGVAFEPLPKIILLSHASEENITKHWLNTVTLHADQQRVKCWPCHRLHEKFDTCNSVTINDAPYAACISDISAETIVTHARHLLGRADNKPVPQLPAAKGFKYYEEKV